MASLQTPDLRSAESAQRRVRLAAALFLLIGCALQWWRMQSLTASMDQGILMQVLWNGLRGHPFESTLSSQLSTNVIHSGELPALGYHRLGQHFTPILALWIPLVGLLGKWALPMLQVVLITASGLVLHRLAQQQLKPDLAAMVKIAFYGANAVIAPCMASARRTVESPITANQQTGRAASSPFISQNLNATCACNSPHRVWLVSTS